MPCLFDIKHSGNEINNLVHGTCSSVCTHGHRSTRISMYTQRHIPTPPTGSGHIPIPPTVSGHIPTPHMGTGLSLGSGTKNIFWALHNHDGSHEELQFRRIAFVNET